MITIQLTRTSREGKAVRGKMIVPLSQKPVRDKYGDLVKENDATIDTLENADFIIPAGTYPLKHTWSPRFKKFLPILLNVPDYSDLPVTGAPDGCQQSASGGESKGRSCPSDLAERYRTSQSPCRMRQGIRIHRGTIPEHSRGCILTNVYGMSILTMFINRLEIPGERDDETFDPLHEDFQITIIDNF